MRRHLNTHTPLVLIWLLCITALLTAYSAVLSLKVRDTISDLEREIERSTLSDCELRNEAVHRFNRFAAEIVVILTEAGPETEGGRRLVAELENRVARLFPEVEC